MPSNSGATFCFFERIGPEGMFALAEVIRYAQSMGLLVIFDGKRNDIGSTATAYAQGILGREESAWRADALTVSPYLGDDSLDPFIDVADQRDAGVFVLVKTSNPGGGMLQDLTTEDGPVYRCVARYVERMAEQSGASPPEFLSTHPAHGTRIARLRQLVPAMRAQYERAPVQYGAGETLPAVLPPPSR